MNYEVVPLIPEHLDHLPLPEGLDRRAYFMGKSQSRCLLVDGFPMFAGGIVDMQWDRGEAWLLPTPFFRRNIKTCLRQMRSYLPVMALGGGFKRVQAACMSGVSSSLFRHLGFAYEGNMRKYGPKGEDCAMFSRIFGEA